MLTLTGGRSREISQFQDSVRAKRYMEDGDRFFVPLVQEDVRLTSARGTIGYLERWRDKEDEVTVHPISSYIYSVAVRLFLSLKCLVSRFFELRAHLSSLGKILGLGIYTAPSPHLERKIIEWITLASRA
ncbi:conserved hypothetical protein [Aspergillus udagawae]|uniref:Uncharacterized protein n=1 Tax=Aspergillus udagawae TaxID=91492 RepID=A0ABQ1B5R6_9EURO|nr:conserved hypothetical protein [Aspergillus udagawae]GFG25577.1 conserved hypothetical protein [Aspergillus udagawae]